MRLKFLTGGLLLFASAAQAQAVVSARGGTCHGTNVTMQWSIGPTVMSTLRSQQTTLPQGFNQDLATSSLTTSAGSPGESIKLHVYPNPVIERLTIAFDEVHDEVHYKVLTQDGKLISAGSFETPIHTVDFSMHASGTYVLVLNQANKPLQSFLILKK